MCRYGLIAQDFPHSERRDMIRRFHDSFFAGHLGASRTVFRLQSHVYWPGLHQDVCTYLASCTICLARKSPCPRRAPMDGTCDSGSSMGSSGHGLIGLVGYVSQGKSVCFSDGGLFLQMDGGLSVARQDCLVSGGYAFFQYVVCHFGMPSVTHSDQGREFENKVMQELCLLCGAHKTKTTPYHPESDVWWNVSI